jgi:hypothetical protein
MAFAKSAKDVRDQGLLVEMTAHGSSRFLESEMPKSLVNMIDEDVTEVLGVGVVSQDLYIRNAETGPRGVILVEETCRWVDMVDGIGIDDGEGLGE